MSALLESLSKFSAAEDFLVFFGVRYDERVVHVYRLHILKRFYQYLKREGDLDALGDTQLHARYGTLLQRAHDDFLESTAAREKVFKIFQDAQGQHIPVERLRGTLPSRSGAPPGAASEQNPE
jgi:nitrogenase-stabilizing/protective protein